MGVTLQTMTARYVISRNDLFWDQIFPFLSIFFTRLRPHKQAGSTESSSVRVYDGDKDYEDESKPSTRRKSTLTCSKTKFCDGFAQKKPIVDQFSKTFNASTCTASRNC